ncbi:MAG: hypothetical protein JW860_00730 [Sedimentisphaerales bacterium]|nr:hypothetical protein [Sedimentisphaerales bacterium]
MSSGFLLYLGKACIGTFIFYSLYWLLFRNDTFHHLKRFYLLAGLCLSLIIPSLTIPVYVDSPIISTVIPAYTYTPVPSITMTGASGSDLIEGSNGPTVVSNPEKIVFSWQSLKSPLLQVLFTVYLAGVFLFLVRLIMQLAQIRQLIRKNARLNVCGHAVVTVSEKVSPFSFFSTIFLNPDECPENELAGIIAHEDIHIRQWHSVDNLFLELIGMVLWFNPMMRFYQKEVRLIHEYLVDAELTQKDFDSEDYQALLLRHCIYPGSFDLASTMNLHPVKRRIFMLNKSKSPKWMRLKIALVLPVLLLLCSTFCFSYLPTPAHTVMAGSINRENLMHNKTHNNQVHLEEAENMFYQIVEDVHTKVWQQRSYICVQLACMQAAGWRDIDYETLMPISGFGAAFGYHPKEKFWAHYVPPPGTDDRIGAATGFGWEWQQFTDIEDYWQALKESIDSGRPVHAPYLEEVMFVGYQEADKKSKRRIRPVDWLEIDRGTWWSWKEFEKWFKEFGRHFGHYTQKVPTISEKETAIETMKTLVRLACYDPRRDDPKYAEVKWGLEGIRAYANDIANLTLKAGDFDGGWVGCYNIYPQWTARILSGKYLEAKADLFPDAIKQQMLAAAQEYYAAHQAWQQWESHLGRAGKGPDNGWRTTEHRLAGAQAVYKALEHEKKAVDLIQKILPELENVQD